MSEPSIRTHCSRRFQRRFWKYHLCHSKVTTLSYWTLLFVDRCEDAFCITYTNRSYQKWSHQVRTLSVLTAKISSLVARESIYPSKVITIIVSPVHAICGVSKELPLVLLTLIRSGQKSEPPS